MRIQYSIQTVTPEVQRFEESGVLSGVRDSLGLPQRQRPDVARPENEGNPPCTNTAIRSVCNP